MIIIFFFKYSDIKCQENPSRGSRVGLTSRHDKGKSHFSQLCNST